MNRDGEKLVVLFTAHVTDIALLLINLYELNTQHQAQEITDFKSARNHKTNGSACIALLLPHVQIGGFLFWQYAADNIRINEANSKPPLD